MLYKYHLLKKKLIKLKNLYHISDFIVLLKQLPKKLCQNVHFKRTSSTRGIPWRNWQEQFRPVKQNTLGDVSRALNENRVSHRLEWIATGYITLHCPTCCINLFFEPLLRSQTSEVRVGVCVCEINDCWHRREFLEIFRCTWYTIKEDMKI